MTLDPGGTVFVSGTTAEVTAFDHIVAAADSSPSHDR